MDARRLAEDVRRRVEPHVLRGGGESGVGRLLRVASGAALLDEGQTTCCYARSEKHWVTDPQGVAWEQFHTLADIPVFSEKKAGGKAIAIPVKAAGSCC